MAGNRVPKRVLVEVQYHRTLPIFDPQTGSSVPVFIVPGRTTIEGRMRRYHGTVWVEFPAVRGGLPLTVLEHAQQKGDVSITDTRHIRENRHEYAG